MENYTHVIHIGATPPPRAILQCPAHPTKVPSQARGWRRFVGLRCLYGCLAGYHMCSADEPRLDAPVHDAHPVLGLDAFVAVPCHVLVEHRRRTRRP